jgi:hypothetical protein
MPSIKNMQPPPQVGQIVRLTNLKENLIVKSVDLDRSTVELIWMTDDPCTLRMIPIIHLLPGEDRAAA